MQKTKKQKILYKKKKIRKDLSPVTRSDREALVSSPFKLIK
jgi:hypothetical protein